VAHPSRRPSRRGDVASSRQGAPNPLFLRHTAAIAGLYVALRDVDNDAGLELSTWRRDDDAWEDWSGYLGPGRVRPDAYVDLRLTVDDTDGVAGTFVEVDFATMDQARLRAKVARHRCSCAETIWWDRHPCCPALLLVTTSEARVNRFLATAEKDRPRPSSYEQEHPAHYEELVAACAAVTSPEVAVVAPVWRAAVGDAPVTLSQLLTPEVRQYRRVVARAQAAWRSLYRRCWLAQADVLVAQHEAIRLSDPRLRRAAAALAAGHLVADYTLEPASPIDGRAAETDAMAHHEARRAAAVTAELAALPLHRRLRVARCDLEAAYDARHLYVCPRCAVPAKVEPDPIERGPLAMTCRCCGGSLVPPGEAPDLPPPLDDSLFRVAARREQLGACR
jgi:hypothetical protein